MRRPDRGRNEAPGYGFWPWGFQAENPAVQRAKQLQEEKDKIRRDVVA